MLTNKINRVISQKRADFINRLLKLTGEEIYAIYGFKRDETDTETIDFPDGTIIDVRLVICENDEPYTEAIMFRDGHEICCSDTEDRFMGTWELEDDNGNVYSVNITSA